MKTRGRVFVFGGARGIGFWFAGRVLSQFLNEIEVFICDTNLPKRIAPHSDFHWCTVGYKDGFIEDIPEDIGASDTIILSVPVNALGSLLNHLERHINGPALVVNFSSIQSSTNRLIIASLPPECIVYGVHLLFGPNVSHPSGNSAIVTDFHAYDRRLPAGRFIERMELSGLYVEYSSSEKHDIMMNVLQVGVHFAFFLFANYLVESKIDFSELMKFKTLPAGFFLSFMARALSQPKLTYANIQLQSAATDTRNCMIKASVDLAERLDGAAKSEEAEAVLTAIASNFLDDDIQEGVSATSAAVRAQEQAARDLHDSIRENRLVGFIVTSRNDSEQIRIGYVIKDEKAHILFDDRLSALKTEQWEGTRGYLLRASKTAEEYYSSIGVSARKNLKTVKYSKKRITFLPGEYVQRWIADNVIFGRLSFPVILSRFDPVSVRLAEEFVVARKGDVFSVHLRDFFVKDNMKISCVCFAQFSPSIPAKEVKCLVIEALRHVSLLSDEDEQPALSDEGGPLP